jgi:hypothetical protein
LALVASVAIQSFGKTQSTPPPTAKQTMHMALREAHEVAVLKLDSFNRRWWPIDSPSAATGVEVRDTTGSEKTQGSGTVVADEVPRVAVVAGRAPPPRHTASDVCSRHGMRKQFFTKPNGWKFWRCRK